MTLEEQLNADLLDATRKNENTRKLAIRSVKAAINAAKVAGPQARALSDQDVLSIIGKEIKQRRDSIEEFSKGGRQDLIEEEAAEIKILEVYLPPQLDEAAVRARAQAVIAELGVSDMKGMGPVMKRLSAELRGQADGQLINRVVRELLS
jgi:uncharacterized protein YqeY